MQENVQLHRAGRHRCQRARRTGGQLSHAIGLAVGGFSAPECAVLPTIRIVGEEVTPIFTPAGRARKDLSLSFVSWKVVPPAVWRYVLHYPFRSK
jgi:hypothetical protein